MTAPGDVEKPKWKKFEDLVAKIQTDLASDCIVTPNDKIVGKRTGVERQVDVSVRRRMGQFEILAIIESKDHARPLDVKDIEEFMGLAQDVGAHKAAIVASNGYSETAKTRAKDAGIELYRVLDTGDHPWRVELACPTICELTGITAFSLTFAATGFFTMRTDIDHREMELFDQEQHPIGKIKDLLHERWNAGAFPTQPGLHRGLEFVQNPVKIQTDGKFYAMNLSANLVVKVRRFFGQLALTDCSGFYDELTGEAFVKEIMTESFEFAEIQKQWRPIESTEELAIKPVVTLRAFDLYGVK